MAPTTTTVPGPHCAYTVPASSPSGYGPCDLQSAYNLFTAETGLSSTPTVAIVDAYNDPDAAADLATYRTKFGLPACTVANGCFRQLNETGGTKLPSNNASWSQEISLDLDTVSAICPGCHIDLVEGTTSGFSDLSTAENTAAGLGVVAISNSYGGSEFSGETADDTAYHHAGIAITVSAGDGDYGVEYPAASPYVTAVGGTSLTKTGGSGRGWSETVWGNEGGEGTGSGCSSQETQPSWQSALKLTGCSRRIVADVSADADPDTGVAVYDSYSYQGSSGWLVFGGTSVASPIIASVYALSGNQTGTGASLAYADPTGLYDVTSGTNSPTGCSPAYLCTAEVAYDGPTGLGTPNGTGAF